MTQSGTFLNTVSSINASNVKELFPDVTVDAQTSAYSAKGSVNAKDDIFQGHDEEQIKLMEELCIVLDVDDKPLASGSKKTCHLMSNIDKGLLHRAFSVFLFDSENRLLLQQRATEKITFPDMWTNTCCSHPLHVSSEIGHDLESSVLGVKRAAVRKLDQELGIVSSQVPIDDFNFLTRIHYVAPSSGVWGEHEIDYILIIKANPTVEANPNEVRDYKFVTKDELKEMFKDESLVFTPWFKLICETYLFKWWDSLDSLDRFKEEGIRRML